MESTSLVHSLMQPEAYPWQPASVELVETHISWVFLAGDRVVKIKRPVDLGFVDHTTLDQRRHSCEEEVRLNRRLTDDVYLGVVPVTRDVDKLVVDGDGPVQEWCTLMRRLPADAMLDVMLRAGTPPPDLGDRLADRLIPFHTSGAPPCPGDPDSLTRMLLGVVTDNLEELEAFPFAPVELGLVADSIRRFVKEHEGWFRERTAHGWVRDGHGDLRCEHICLEPDRPPQIYDCVEFNPDLRCADVASDLAFLLMDLDRLGAGPAATRLLERYREAGFELPDAILRLYWAHRALVRAKVWLLRDPDRLAHADRAAGYLHLAARQVLGTRPALFCMTGLSGTGKSVIARELAAALGLPVMASDRIRKEQAGVSGSAAAAWREGIYTPERTDATYRAMHDGAGDFLAAGTPVLLDATYLDSQRRSAAAQVATRLEVPFVLIETTCDDREVRRRLLARASEAKDPSDAGTPVYDRQLARARQYPPEVPPGTVHIVVDTTDATATPLEPVLRELARRDIVLPLIQDRPPSLA